MATQTKLKRVIAPFLLNIQKCFRISPRGICLISGAPRSGTSALNDWLGSQPSVATFPESRILVSVNAFIEEAFRFKNLERDRSEIEKLARHLIYDYYLNSRVLFGKKLVVEKEPLEPIAFPSKNYQQFILNMREILPDLKLLFIIRDPVATIWSMSRRTWGESLTTPESRRFSLDEYAENWRASADIALQIPSIPNAYLLQFGNLVNHPESESEKIFDFLNIHEGVFFQPRPTSEVSFSKNERNRILQNVQPKLEELRLQGIANL